MAASLLLRQGRAGALKTVLEARVFRGLAATVSLSAESGKNEKGLPPNPKKQSPPKNVVEPKERGKPLATPPAAELSKNLPPPSSSWSVVNGGRTVANPNPGDSLLVTEEGLPKCLSRKTLVEFPQKALPPSRKQGSGSDAVLGSRRATGGSSSSSSSSSDSESDEEGDSPGADRPVKSKGRGGFPKAEAPRSIVNGAPQIGVSQQPHADLSSPERPRQAKKKGASRKPVEDRKDTKPKTTAPTSQEGEEFTKQSGKEKQLHRAARANDIDKGSQKAAEVKKVSSDHTKSGFSTRPDGDPAPTPSTETRAGTQLQATPPGAGGRRGESQVPSPDGEVASAPLRNENVGKPVADGLLKAEGDLEDQLPVKHLKPAPVHHKDALDEKTTGLQLEEKDEVMEDSATPVEGRDHAQGPAQAAASAEPFDNSTYKNLQHHDYSTYTFLDLNLDLLKFRMPQPSSGRESPRH
ncbi:NADH dehydrogenase [ubiquinone] flavoprotein 3, mitochondrial isoform X1 [Camelus bactrianus]|uniref:NADH dehydrogenase [ubiquinone] flavoprotein 3, mitochondrial isoform X1 n=1 Tax=Camelus bactrianus TaxID=9837 RepID=A0AC58P1M2_CAMBA